MNLSPQVTAIDPEKTKGLAVALYTALTSCVATATSDTAASVTMGLNIGSQVAANLRGILLPLIERVKGSVHHELSQISPNARKALDFVMNAAAHSAGIALAFFIVLTA